jgi:hypothetical protein
MLMPILMQIACSKLDEKNDRNEFIKSLKGEWKLTLFTKTPFQTGSPGSMFIQDGGDDSVFYVEDDDTTRISVNDPNLCTLPGIENMQRWTVTESKKDLFLETIDLCGTNNNYQIEFKNVSTSYDAGWYDIDRDIKADVSLIGPVTTLILDEFVIHEDYILYYRSDSQFKYSYYLVRYNYR